MAANGRPSAGDLTGRQKQAANKEQREEQASRAAEISMQDGAQSQAEQHGVFDAQSGAQIDGPGSRQAVVVEKAPVTRDRFNRPEETILTGQEDPDVVAPVIAAHKQFTPPPVEVVRSSRVRIRVDADVDEMTYGMFNGEPNNYTFKEGLQYEVPLPVAEHLNDRGLIRQWISG
jgi:hypothetical protein